MMLDNFPTEHRHFLVTDAQLAWKERTATETPVISRSTRLLSKRESEMAIKEAVFIMFFIALLEATDAKQPDESGGLSENLFLTYVNDGSDGTGIGEQIEEKMNKIKQLVRKKRFKKFRKQVLTLLDELSAMTEQCASPPSRPPESECEAGWVRHGQSCYYIDDTPTQAWSTARLACQSRGADLPIIQSAEENEFIANLVLKQDTVTYGGAWIGIQRNQEDDKLYWIDGTPIAGGYTAWAPGNPSNSFGKQDCGNILGETGSRKEYRGKWDDTHCSFGFAFLSPVILCEKSI